MVILFNKNPEQNFLEDYHRKILDEILVKKSWWTDSAHQQNHTFTRETYIL